MENNRDLCSFFVTKHSWKGKYKRIFSIGTACITTYHPATMEVTNRWPYCDVLSLLPVIPKVTFGDATYTAGGNELFTFTFITKKRKQDTFKFSSEYRSEILCSALMFRRFFSEMTTKLQISKYRLAKQHWSDRRLPVLLELDVAGVNHLHELTNQVLTTYLYKDVDSISTVSDVPGGFLIATSGFNRLHMFIASSDSQRDEILRKISENAWTYTGTIIRPRKEPISLEQFQVTRFGRYSNDESLTSLYEFTVHKVNARNAQEPVKRTLALTDNCLIERDPNSYSIITLKPLQEVFALVRSSTNPQCFSIEYIKGQVLTYTSTDRDALLASLLDGVRASGNIDVHVKMEPTIRGYRIGPYSMPVDEEVESWHLKFLQAPPINWSFNESIVRFNANCAYSGLLHSVTQDRLFAENKEKLIKIALGAFVENEGDQDEISNEHLEQQFQCLRRLVASKAGFTSFTICSRFRDCLGKKVVKALKRNNDAVIHSAIDMLCALMQPMHDDYDLRQEQLNKSSLLSSKEFLGSLLDVMQYHVDCGTGALVVASMLDLLTFALCPPYSETTDGNHFDVLLAMTATYGKSLFKLFQHPSLAIVKGAGLVMKAIIEEAEMETSRKMQDLALAEGAFPRHLQMALFSPESDSRYIACQHLSRQLVGLWTVDNEIAHNLLNRIFPVGLLSFLESKEKPPANWFKRPVERNNLKMAEEIGLRPKQNALTAMRDHPSVRLLEKQVEGALKHWREKIGVPKRETLQDRMAARPVILRKRRERIKCSANWSLFFYHFFQDHARPDLIWNYKTREELRDALENEIRAFQTSKELSSKNLSLAWNHREFEVLYASLTNELKIGDCYLRLLLEEGEKGLLEQLENSLGEETDKLADRLRIRKPYEFFNELYHKFLLATNGPLSASCLHAMAIVYGVYHEQIGSFHDVKWLIATLGTTRDRLQRDRMLLLIRRLCVREENVKQLLDADGVRVLVDLLPLAHLHVNRAAPAASSNVLEASETMQKEQTDAQLEWHYADAEGTKQGPFSYGELKKRFDKGELNEQTRCWAQGIDGWRVLSEIAQLKWTLLASGNQMLNETQMAAVILDTLNAICDFYPSRDESGAIVRPLPRVKRRLSDQTCLPHVVQLLLTFDPTLVERVASLLVKVLEDNPAISRLYLTGAFFFMLMYSGSNVLHIGRLLHMTHLQQAFRAEERLRTSAMLQRSFLGQLLPSAMICYLEHHGPDKFAQILLGEFDTPETIWSGEMRRLLARKLAAHVADFSPRLRSNTRALYQYCPMPAVGYPQLENELFCNAYYLKNLCDSARFANWPIREPVQLLKDILDAWKEEVNKKPSTMSSNEALRVLELDENILTQLREQEDQLTENGISLAENAAIRKAYFKLAQKYHPDKNPEGRDRFEEINRAYEWLCGEASARNRGGPNPMHIRLMLQAQSILFQQCGVQLQAYKYAGYPMLVSTLRLETEDEKLFSKPCPLLAYACETAYHTIKCSALNAEELRREGGLEILQAAFARCVAVLGESSTPDCVGAQVCTHIVRCFTGAAAFPACRKRLLQLRCIGGDLARLLQLDQLIRLALCTVQCVSAFAADARLSEQMVNSGALHSLLVFLFKYDYTLEEGGVESNEQSNQQELANQLAKVSLIALARLAGELSTEEMDAAVAAEKLEKAEQRKASQVKSDQLIDFAEPNAPSSQVIHAQVQRCLAALLTPYLSRQLGVASAATLLKTLTSNEQQPYLIWDNGTRAELLDFLSKGQSACSKNSISLEQLVQQCTSFVYTAHRKELVIGDVFVRIYNQQPAYQLIEPKAFTVALLDYIGSQTQYFHSADMLQRNADSPVNGSESPKNTPSSPARVANMEMALEALCNVIKHNSGVENACIGHFRLLFLLLRVQKSLQMRLLGVQLICAVSGSQECVADIAASEVLVNLLLLLRPPITFNEKASNVAEMRVLLAQLQTAVLDALLPLMANSKLVREALTRGGVLYLLEGFCIGGGAAASGMRERCAELLAKMASDKLVGPKVRLQLMRFLPPLFVDAMNDSPSGAVQLFDASQENPELIWNEQCKASVCRTLRQLASQLSEQQWVDQSILWNPPEDLQAEQTSLSDELQVSGVYVRLFVANPTWLLRKPKQFLTELLNQFQRLLASDKMDEETLKLLGSGALALLSAQPALMDLLPAMGYVPELLNALANASTKPPFVVECCVRLIEQCSQSRACVDTLVQYEKLAARMEDALKAQPSLAGPVCDCLLRLLQVNGESIMVQLTSGKLVNILMRMLDDASTGTAGKAQIVRLLKAMCECGVRGEQLAATLDKSGLWHEFRDQKHDLFISSQPTAGFITAGVPNVAGYLTQSNQTVNMQMPSDPPPIDEY